MGLSNLKAHKFVTELLPCCQDSGLLIRYFAKDQATKLSSQHSLPIHSKLT